MRFVAGESIGGEPVRLLCGLREWARNQWESWSDVRFARRESRLALSLLRQVHDDRPDLEGRALYLEVLSRCACGGAASAGDLVRRAEQSFAAWPVSRRVRFRDVVSYVVFDEKVVRRHRAGTLADIEAAVATVIPRSL